MQIKIPLFVSLRCCVFCRCVYHYQNSNLDVVMSSRVGTKRRRKLVGAGRYTSETAPHEQQRHKKGRMRANACNTRTHITRMFVIVCPTRRRKERSRLPSGSNGFASAFLRKMSQHVINSFNRSDTHTHTRFSVGIVPTTEQNSAPNVCYRATQT